MRYISLLLIFSSYHTELNHIYSQNLQFVHLDGPYGANIYSLGRVSSGIVFVSVTGTPSGKSFRSDNYGNSWEKNFGGTLISYLFKADSIGWAVCDGSVYKTDDNGYTWRWISGLSLVLQTFDRFNNILACDDRWVALSTDGGYTWETIGTPTTLPEGFGSRHMAVSQNNTLYVGTRWGLYCSTDYGTNWQLAGLLNYDIGFIKIDQNDFIYLRTPSIGPSSTLLRSIDRGRSWEQIDSTFTKRSYTSLFCGRNNRLYLTIKGGGIFSSDDCGEHWIERNGDLGDLYVNMVVQDNFGTLYVGCKYKGIFRSLDEGQTWTQCPFNITSIRSIQQGPGGSVLASSSAGGIYSSMNSGKSWQFLGLDDGLISKFIVRQDGHITVSTSTSKSHPFHESEKIFVSTNYGKDWTHTLRLYGGFAGVNFAYSMVYDASGNIFIASARDQIFRSRDNGFTWENIKIEEGLTVNCLAVDDSILYASTTNGRMYLSSDTGNHWRYYMIGIGTGVYTFRIAGKDTLIAGTPSGFYISSDKGEHWTKKNVGLLDTTVGKVIVAKNGDFFLCTSKKENYSNYIKDVYRSKNRGDLWELVATNVSEMNINDIFIDEDGFLYLGTDGDGIYRTMSSVTKTEQEPTYRPCEFELYQNFPNPFNSRTNIHLSLPVTSLVTLKVYDVLGREVATLLNERVEKGLHSIVWDAVNVSSGLYFCRLQAGERSFTIKMILSK